MAAFGGLYYEPREPDMPPPPLHNPFEFFRAQIDLEIARINANVHIHIANAQVEIARINAKACVEIAEIGQTKMWKLLKFKQTLRVYTILPSPKYVPINYFIPISSTIRLVSIFEPNVLIID